MFTSLINNFKKQVCHSSFSERVDKEITWLPIITTSMIHEKLFRERLAVLIGERGSKTFERRTGVSESNIHLYLGGECLPTLGVLEKIASANNVSVGWLIGEEQFPQLANLIADQMQSRSLEEIAQWITEQDDGINYWEVLKATLSREFPDFKQWLQERNGQK